jgi:FGGY-family pentulose kinase
LLGSASTPIQIWRPRPDYVEQSSEDIWRSVCSSVHEASLKAGIDGEEISGISFDATCSLVVLDREGQPLSIDTEGDPQHNIMVWMDHRALAETETINSGNYDVLQYVGGKLSPEMETPKLLWIKKHLPDTWRKAGKFLDLADYLTYRSSGIDARSLCTVVCKWTYDGHAGAWDRTFFEAIGLADLFDGRRVVDEVRPMGTRLGNLTPQAATDLGLSTNCAVGVGIIDAHAGGLGVLGAIWDGTATTDPAKLETALALIGGTSNCHMAVSREPVYINGIWGPYFGAMVPGVWLTEGGQSSAGSAIDHVVADHANAAHLKSSADDQGVTVYELLNGEIDRLTAAQSLPYSALLTRDLHVLPYRAGFERQ